MKYDVVCIGSAVLDIYLKSEDFKETSIGDFEGGVGLCEVYGGKMEADQVSVTSGGGATNAAVSFARKDLKTGIIAEMGKDLLGAAIKAELEKEKVDCSYLIEEPTEETGVSVVLVNQGGGRAIVVYRGANKLLTREDVRWDNLDASWFYISSLGGRVELMQELVYFAAKKGIKVALNPGKSEIEKLRLGPVQDFLGQVEVLLVNREEAELLTNIPFKDETVWKGESCIYGPRVSLVTDGGNGGKVCYQGKCQHYQAIPVKMIEQTGAGDAFGSGFVSALAKGMPVERAIEWGQRQSARVVQHMGPKKGLMTLAEIEEADLL